MNKKRFSIVIGLTFAICMVFFLYSLETISASGCHIIKVNAGMGRQPVTIDPETLVISAGDCVVWFNNSRDQIKISFRGRGDTCASPSGFFKEQECFITSWYRQGSTTSMQLMEKGIYEYEVKTKVDAVTGAKGKIEVK